MLTSHIGSLPFTSIKEAEDFNSRFSLPVLFTLPKLNPSEFMISQVLGETMDFSNETMKRKLDVDYTDSIKNYAHFKFQIVGPITLLKSINNISDFSKKEILDWHFKNIKNCLSSDLKKKCYFFLDEPSLYCASKDEFKVLNDFIRQLNNEFYKIGLHCCSRFDFDYLDQSELDGVSIESKHLDQYNIDENLDIFLGVIDTKSLKPSAIIDTSRFKNNIYLTPDCGLALSDLKKTLSVPENLSSWAKMAQDG